MNTWDEKNYTKPKSNCLNNSEQEPSDTTKITKSDSTQPQWIDIGGVKKWIRTCPKCNCRVFHTTERLCKRFIGKICHKCGIAKATDTKRKNKVPITPQDLIRNCPQCGIDMTCSCIKYKRKADRRGTLCKSCIWKNKITPELLSRNCPQCGTKIQYSNRRNRRVCEKRKSVCKVCQNENQSKSLSGISLEEKLGIDAANEMRLKQSKKLKGMKKSEEWKRKARIRRSQMVSESVGGPAYNFKACIFLDNLSKRRGWVIQHAKNGGEIKIDGYFVDGYDKDRNIVIEYDERHHYIGGKLKQKDVDRMHNIIQHTGCRFYRYDERTKKLKKYN
jgi:hypothetical protein